MPTLPDVQLPTGPVARPHIRVATILDPFSALAFHYEWDQTPVSPSSWKHELADSHPDLLFVESAWRGNDGSWRLAMSTTRGPSEELQALVSWCKENHIPTVFWNKEDPPNYDRFIETAKLFDNVFTVDSNMIPRYQKDLGHNRVSLLPFAAQPKIHNPIQHGREVKRNVAFAGSYFREKHPERRKQMDDLLYPAAQHDLHIYARSAATDIRYRYPETLEPHIVGSLDYAQMLSATQSYKVFLNVNSVTNSPSMCARRIFELSAAQVPILSGPAQSIEPFFGSDIMVAANRDEAEQSLKVLLNHREFRDRLSLRAHRTVFDRHLYTHRATEVLRTVGIADEPLEVSVSVVVPTMRPQKLEAIFEFIGRQTHQPLELILVAHGYSPEEPILTDLARAHGVTSYEVVHADASTSLGHCMNEGLHAASGRYVAKMDDDNYYGPNYIKDLVRAFDYSGAAVVGKWAHYTHLTSTGATVLRFPASEHRFVNLVQGGTIMADRNVALQVGFADIPRRVDTTFLEGVRKIGGKVYAADRFNFVSVRDTSPAGHTWPITDLEILAKPSELVAYGDPTAHVTV